MSELPAIEFEKNLEAHTTPIPGLVWFDIPVHGDNRGWFKENFQRRKQLPLGMPDLGPVQNNISYNAKAGVTRGIHAEPWDKYISTGAGRVFGAWVDLREGETFGQSFTLEIDPSKAIYVPRGVGNSFQALDDGTVYTYLVNDHWSAEAQQLYTFVNLADPSLAIQWPIPLEQAELSDKDKAHPYLDAVTPMKPRKILVTGANGQVGKALREEFPDADFTDRSTLDITDADSFKNYNWRQYQAIINAGAYTKVDAAETPEGKKEAWLANVTAVQNLARIAIENGLTLIHFSSDYVFNGIASEHTEDEVFSPLNVYGQSKAAGDIAAATVPQHYILRTSWVVGEGNNFVKVMQSLAEKDIAPSVVNDQIGRLTFAKDLARGARHLLNSKAPYGTYNLTSDGQPASWAAIAKRVYELTSHNPDDVNGVTTVEYYAGKDGTAPRPLQSTLTIDKIKAVGFTPSNWEVALKEYLDAQS